MDEEEMTDTPPTEIQVPTAANAEAMTIRDDLLARLEWVEAEARQAWERSKTLIDTGKDSAERKAVYSDAENGMVYADASGEMVYAPGDPKFLAQVERCVMAKAKLLGVKEPGPGEYIAVETVRGRWDLAMGKLREALESAVKGVAPKLSRPTAEKTIRKRLTGAVIGAFDKARED